MDNSYNSFTYNKELSFENELVLSDENTGPITRKMKGIPTPNFYIETPNYTNGILFDQENNDSLNHDLNDLARWIWYGNEGYKRLIIQSYYPEDFGENILVSPNIEQAKQHENKNIGEKIKSEIFKINKVKHMKNEEKKNIINNEINNNLPTISTKKDIIKTFKKTVKNKIYIKKLENGHLNKNIKNSIKPYYERKRKKKRTKIKKHTRNSTDLILKKTKNQLLKKLIDSCNKTVNDKKYKLKYFDYKHTSQIKKFSEIENFNSKIGDLLVKMPISEKYKNAKNKTNKETAKKILENKGNNIKIRYLFNLTFSEWIDIFTRKKEPSCEVNLNDEFDSLLKTLFEKAKGNGNYFSKVIYCLYNYQRLILCKNSRENKKK